MKQKLNSFLIIVFILLSIQVYSQSGLYISAGSNFFISSSTVVSIDSLVLIPSAPFDIVGANAETRDATAVPPPPSPYIQRVYHFSALLPSYNGDISIYYRDAELNGLDENTLTLNIYNGSMWNAYTTGVTRDPINNFVTTAALSNLIIQQATLAGPLAALPVTLSKFILQNDQCVALIKWTTASEQNSKHFEVQQSTDGVNFNTIAIVKASGNSNVEKHYSFSSPLVNANNYFRLRIIDLDGSMDVSTIIIARGNCANNVLIIYPNPARNEATINGLQPGTQLRIMDNLGQVVRVMKTSNRTETINLVNLPAGNYIVQVITGGKMIANLKLIKE